MAFFSQGLSAFMNHFYLPGTRFFMSQILKHRFLRLSLLGRHIDGSVSTPLKDWGVQCADALM
jgi:hypothetical protein